MSATPPVPVVRPPEPPAPLASVCANCGAPLADKFCAACGQRHDPHIHSVTHFAGEAFESLTHADSRLWRTLGYLLVHPGRLTREFFEGKRARYLPPFRLYLVLSVVFFLITRLPSSDVEQVNPVGDRAAAGTPTEINPAGVPQPTDAEKARAAIAKAAAKVEAAGGDATLLREGASDPILIDSEGFNDFCEPFAAAETGGPGARARNNLRRFCQRVRNDSAALGDAVVANLPRAMFLFLPLFAGIMTVLYWRPKRYFVEHLLFLVHSHAFVFLTFSLVTLLSLALAPLIGGYVAWLFTATFLYMVWYIFRAMRNYYEQGRALTLAKYLVLGASYVITSLVVLILTLVLTAIAG